MASPVPVKSQPLHNFSLPHLKWKKNQTTNNHHRGRSRLSCDSSPPHHQSPQQPQPQPQSYVARRQSSPSYASRRQSSPSYAPRRQSPLLDSSRYQYQSPMRDSESESEKIPISAKTGISIFSTDHIIDKRPERKSGESNPKLVFPGDKGKRSKISIRFRKNKQDETLTDEVDEKSSPAEGEEEETLPKTWNLRPRRPLNKLPNGIGAGNGNGAAPKSSLMENNKAHEQKNSEVNSVEKKQKFSIGLSREEIEEDVFALTGSKASRRPKKRPRTIQKQLDTLFPGLWLGSITPDSYKVSEAPPKV